jgi:ABC-2 type transport system permease protein
MYWAVNDAFTLIGRNVRHSVRSVDALLTAVMLPVLILLLFVYVFGGAIQTGGDYVDYVVPGIILLCAGFGSATTAVAVCEDMTNGVIDRFRSLPIAGATVLTGHVVASVLRNVASTAIVVGVALAAGFSPDAGPLGWLGAIGVLLAFMFAISWLAAAFGLLASNLEAAGSFAFIVMFLPYVSSAFVPPETMPAALEAIARHQPITPITETVRALLMGGSAGGDAIVAVAWCAGGIAVGSVAAALLFRSRNRGEGRP